MCRSPLGDLQNRSRKPRPLLALPVEALHGYYSLFPKEPRQKRKERRPERVVVHDVVIAETCMNRAQQRMDESLKMLGADGRQPHDFDARIFFLMRSEIGTAVGRDLMTPRGE